MNKNFIYGTSYGDFIELYRTGQKNNTTTLGLPAPRAHLRNKS